MRLWSIHPKYLDAKGLVALWREGLLAKKVLEGKTKGYTRHPQLLRFKQCQSPLEAINLYLKVVLQEATTRGYNFDKSKLQIPAEKKLTQTRDEGQRKIVSRTSQRGGGQGYHQPAVG